MKSIISLILCCSFAISAQTGGNYKIEKSVIATGGAASTGGGFTLESTVGQSAAGGFIQNPSQAVYSGFWTPGFAPTAAEVSVGGRVLTADGRGIQNARVTLIFPNGTAQTSLTGSFGYYRFDELPVGQTYVLTVSSKRFIFVNPSQFVTVTEELTELNFIAAP